MKNEKEILNEELQQQEEQEVPVEDEDLLKKIEEMKETMVPKSKYDRLVERNKKLTDAYLNNQKIEDEEPKEKNSEKIPRLQKELYGEDRKEMSNLEYMSKTVELRDAIIEEGGRDPFLPTSGPEKDSAAAKESAEKVANGLRKMVEDAQGSPEAFNSLYQARVEDVAIPSRNKNIYRR